MGFFSLLLGYLLGSIPSGWLAGRWLKDIDLRELGSGSTGATNVLRQVGKGPALVVFLIDVGKGAAAVLIHKPEKKIQELGILADLKLLVHHFELAKRIKDILWHAFGKIYKAVSFKDLNPTNHASFQS